MIFIWLKPDVVMLIPMTMRCSHSPRVPRLGSIAAVFLLNGALLFSGCISNKYQAASALDARPQRMDIDLGGGPGLKTRLDTVIIYQGPGSWKKAAFWDEFVLTIANESSEAITLTSASLVDYAGTDVPAGSDPWQLERASQAQRDRYARAGVSFALNTLGYAAFTTGAVSAGVMVGAATTGTWGGVAAGATVGLVAVPVTAIVIYANNQKHKQEIEGEFNRRRLALPLRLLPGANLAGSLFFPMTVSPQSLRLAWARGGVHGIITLTLPMLAGMHRKEAEK
jgi:hypothetical protein